MSKKIRKWILIPRTQCLSDKPTGITPSWIYTDFFRIFISCPNNHPSIWQKTTILIKISKKVKLLFIFYVEGVARKLTMMFRRELLFSHKNLIFLIDLPHMNMSCVNFLSMCGESCENINFLFKRRAL